MKCTVTGEPKGGITWIRPDGKRVLNCAFPMSTCKILVARYGARKFEPSVYYLTIQSFNVELDVGKWTCKEGSGHVESSCEKTSEGKSVKAILAVKILARYVADRFYNRSFIVIIIITIIIIIIIIIIS